MKKGAYEILAAFRATEAEAVAFRKELERKLESEKDMEIRWLGELGNFDSVLYDGLIEQIIEDEISDEVIYNVA